jgi:hypothetical protein
MAKKILALFVLGMIVGAASAQTTTTYTGTIKDLAQNVVTSGQVTFSLAPSVDSTVSGVGRFTPTIVPCNINTDGTLSGYVAGVVSGACIVTRNTAISPSGTSYRVCIQPYFASPGSCFYDYATVTTKDISTVAPTLSTGPLNYGGIPGPPGCVLGSTCTSALTPLSVNGVLAPEQFAGLDIGAKINAAFASCASSAGGSCALQLSPGQNYSFSTQFHIPGDATDGSGFMSLDCKGSTLTWTGAGDASQVMAQNSDRPSGLIKDCVLVNGSGNTAAVDGIHQFSRGAMQYERVTVNGFSNSTSSGLHLDNSATVWGGYNERLYLNRFTVGNNTKGVRYQGSNGGTNSFGYNTMVSAECNTVEGQICISVEGTGSALSADLYGGFFDMKVNGAVTTTRGRVVSVTNGGAFRRSLVNFTAESFGSLLGYMFYVDSNASGINVTGNVIASNMTNFNGGTSDSIIAPQLNSTFVLQNPAYATGLQQARNSKYIWDGNNVRYGMASNGGVEKNGFFQLFSRATTDGTDPEVDATSGLTPQVNMQYCVPNAGCGFGAGYGPSATQGGTLVPTTPLESTASSIRNAALGTTADGGVIVSTTIDSGGNGIRRMGGGSSGQPSFHMKDTFRSYISFTDVDGIDCFAGANVSCKVPDLQLVPSATVCTAANAGKLNYISGATGVKDTVQICAKDATNVYAYRSLY